MDKLEAADSQTMEGPWYTELWPGTSSWVEFSRTQQTDFGWDWSLAAAP
jgi:hypothetical protein